MVAAAQHLMSHHDFPSVAALCGNIVEAFGVIPSPSMSGQKQREHLDGVHVYALDVLNLGLLYQGFHDAIREGDGDRVVLYWKAMMIVFKGTNRRNYGKEAFLLLFQLQSSSERVAEQIKWSRFVNKKGRVGCNIPCDLALEHLNRRLKTIIHNLGANVVPSAIVRAAKSIGVVDTVCELFEQSVQSHPSSDHHTVAKDNKDFKLVLETLLEKDIFKEENGRNHTHFKHTSTVIERVDKKTFVAWIERLLRECTELFECTDAEDIDQETVVEFA